MARRQVGFTLDGDGNVEQRLPQFGGIKGEHNATRFDITVIAESFYQDGDIARLEFYAGDGTALSSDIIDDINVEGDHTSWSYMIPKMLTMLGGQLCIRLVLSRMDDDGNEVETFRSGEMVVWFEDAHVENGTPFWTGVSEMLKRTVSAKEAAVNAQETAIESAQTATLMKASAQDSADRAATSAQDAIAAKNAAVQSCATASTASVQAVSAANRASNAAATAEEQAVASSQSASEASASVRKAIEAQQAAVAAEANAKLVGSAVAASAQEAKTAASEAKAAAAEAGNAADQAVADYFEKNPIESGATEEQVEKIDDTASLLAAHIANSTKAVAAKLDKSGHAAGKYFGTDDNGNVITVDACAIRDEDKADIVDMVTAGSRGYISIPKYVHVKTNSEFSLYFRNVMSRDDVILWVGYHNSLITRYYEDRLSVTAMADGEYTLPWKVYDKAHRMLDSGELSVIATAKVPSETTKIIVIGDSTVNAGMMTDNAQALYTADGATLMCMGTRGNGTHEGRGGWTAEMYCTLASYGDVENPFYNNGFDFAYYMADQSFDDIQAVVIQLGINDIFVFKDYDWALYDSKDILAYIDDMIASVLAYDSAIKVIVNLPTTPNSKAAAFTEAYGTTQLYQTYNRNSIRFAEDLIRHYADHTNVTVSASNCILDTKTQIFDGVHPTTDGYHALGQRLYEVLVSITEGKTYVTPLLDIESRTRVQHTGGSITGTSARELDTAKCYDEVFNGGRANNSVITMYTPTGGNGLSIQVSTAGGTGMNFPVALETGKSYTLKYTLDNTGRVYVMKYNADTTFQSNEMLSSTAGTFTKTITPEDGYVYSIIFVPMVKDVPVTFSDVSLTET